MISSEKNIKTTRGGEAASVRQLAIRSRRQRVIRTVILIVVAIAIVSTITLCLWWWNHRNSVKLQQTERAKELGLVSTPVTEQDKANYHVDDNKPRFISIESIGLKQARVQELGLLAPKNGSQQMDAPKNIYDAGWYNCAINPVKGNRCSNYITPSGNDTEYASIIDGHSCDGDGCVFDKLSSLKAGDMIKIQMGSGSSVQYKIDKVEVVKLEQLDMKKVMVPYQKGKSGLNLITCDGSWTKRDSRGVATMDKRVVVYSTKQ